MAAVMFGAGLISGVLATAFAAYWYVTHYK